MSKPQTAWAIVSTARSNIHIGSMAYARKSVIENVIREWRGYASPRVNGTGKTDAQFWRWLKKQYGWEVRRVQIRVMK